MANNFTQLLGLAESSILVLREMKLRIHYLGKIKFLPLQFNLSVIFYFILVQQSYRQNS